MNDQLQELYRGVWMQLESLAERFDLSWPHLMKVPEGYHAAAVKVMVVGQTTNDWLVTDHRRSDVGSDEVETLMSVYPGLPRILDPPFAEIEVGGDVKRAFRTYHPNFLRLRRQWHRVTEIGEAIAGMAQSASPWWSNGRVVVIKRDLIRLQPQQATNRHASSAARSARSSS